MISIRVIGWKDSGVGNATFDAFCMQQWSLTSPTCPNTRWMWKQFGGIITGLYMIQLSGIYNLMVISDNIGLSE